MRCILYFTAILALVVPAAKVEAGEKAITHEELLDKLSGFWIGQILGNYMDFPFENNYVEEPAVQNPLFVKGVGEYNIYRIPALLTTQAGTLLAFCEGREAGDSSDIDLLLRRSQDGGETWLPKQVVWDQGKNVCGNPCPVQDRDTGIIWLLLTWNSSADSGGALHKGTGKDTRRVYVCSSKDDGMTWSEPVEITETTKKKNWWWYATGPGVGIQLEQGPHKGRLVIPCDHTSKDGYGSHVIYSDDHGGTWQLGGSVEGGANECQVVELAGGTLMLNMRIQKGSQGKRGIATSRDDGETWSELELDPALIEPVCQASFLRYSPASSKGKNRLLFSNPASTAKRVNMTVRISYDEGKTWPFARQLYTGHSAYSCLTVLPDGDIACFYEAGETKYAAIYFARFPLAWLETSPNDTGAPGRDRYLLLDSRIIDNTENAELTLGTVKKDPRNPLFMEDKQWEPRYDNVYANVIYDEQDRLYKCWYSPFIIDERTTSTPEVERNPSDHDYMRVKPNGREMGVCYAVSEDGIHWEKPELGLVEFDGNKKNNILMRGYHFRGVFTGPHGAGVFKDLHESDTAKRYKMFFKGSKMTVAFSPDGLHWSLPIECPRIDAHGDTHNNAFWAPDLGKYIGITRLKYGRPSIRQVAWAESADFINWTKAKVVLEGVKPRLQTHDMVVFPIGGVYIGLLGMMNFPNAKSNFHTRQHVELAWSPDSKEWHRIQPGTPFIGHTPAKKEVYGKMPYDWGTIFASAPIFREDEIQIYYGACDWYFFDWRKGYLALGTLRPDGWAGYEQIAGDKPAIITTAPVVCTGNELQLCADVQESGYVKVMLFDKDNKQLAESKPIKQTVTDAVVKWQKGFSIKDVKGKDIRLKFELKNAKLYSFGFNLKPQAKIDLALSKSVVDRKEDVERIVAELIELKKTWEEAHRKKERAEQIRRSLSPEERIPDHIAELRNVNPDVRSNASDQLAEIALRVKHIAALEPAVAPLVAALLDKDMDVRDESTEALGNIGSRIKDKALRRFVVDALVRMLSDEDAEVREEAAEALGNIASSITDKSVLQLAVAPLTKALKDDREAVRKFAVQALEHIGAPKAREDWAAVDGVTSMKRDRYLLLDSRLVESAENARLTLGKTQKSKHNPLFAEDKPWEKRFDNLYANVIYDEAEGIYKCWYSPFIVDKSAKGMTLEERKQERYRAPRNREMAICYAISKDGIAWVKPELGIAEYEASKANNILWRGSGDRKKLWGGPHGSGIFKDLRDPDPKRRYKAFLKAEILSVAFSADGIHWGPAITCPEADSAGDTHNNAFWAPTLGKYVGITREWGNAFGRQVARTSSVDFVNWSKSEVVLEGLDKGHQTYAMPVFYHGGVYLGLVAIHDQKADRVWTELTWSPDTVTWRRVLPGTPLIANSRKEGDYDWGCVYASACPVFLEDEIRLYYGGSDGYHFGWRNGFFCLATLRPDGWAGYEPVAANQPARIKTTPVVCTGKGLRICADVEKNGYVKIELLDSDNKPLAQGELIAKTVTDGPIQWKDGFSFKKLEGKEIKLRFELRESKLYSFSFESLEREEQPDRYGFVSIFDGKTIEGWHAAPIESASDWTVRDGAIVGHGSADRLSYLVWKDEDLTDFELELRYRLPGKGNTGVEIRSQPDPTGHRPADPRQGYAGRIQRHSAQTTRLGIAVRRAGSDRLAE